MQPIMRLATAGVKFPHWTKARPHEVKKRLAKSIKFGINFIWNAS
jgi:hypothetical protein